MTRTPPAPNPRTPPAPNPRTPPAPNPRTPPAPNRPGYCCPPIHHAWMPDE